MTVCSIPEVPNVQSQPLPVAYASPTLVVGGEASACGAEARNAGTASSWQSSPNTQNRANLRMLTSPTDDRASRTGVGFY